MKWSVDRVELQVGMAVQVTIKRCAGNSSSLLDFVVVEQVRDSCSGEIELFGREIPG